MLKQVLTGATSSSGIVPLGSFSPLYTSTITIVSNKFVIPAGGDGYYIFNLTGYTNDTNITRISILKNDVAFTENTTGVVGAWTTISGMEYLSAGDTLHFFSVGNVGFINASAIFIGRLFESMTSPYRTCNAAFRVATAYNGVATPTVYPMGSNTKTVYGTTADLPTNSSIQHLGTDEVSIISIAYSIAGVNTNKGVQLTGGTAYGSRNVFFAGLTSGDPYDFAELMVLCNQSIGSANLTFYGTPASATVFEGSSLGLIKYT